MSLPAGWVDRIFERLTVVYGRDFLGRWEGMDLNAVKSNWGHELDGYERFPQDIAWAFDHLPDRAPSVVEFRRIVRSAPAADAPRLEHSPAGKERIAAELAKVNITKPVSGGKDYRAWAKAIVARHASGDCITRTQLGMAKEALGVA